MDISLITSLYRTDDYLEHYLDLAQMIIDKVQEAGKSIEIILIANDATHLERKMLNALPSTYCDNFRVHFIPRETVYASWNRGVELAQGQALTFWGVDDIRTAEGIIEGHNYISNGCLLYYAPYKINVDMVQYGIRDIRYTRTLEVPQFERNLFTTESIPGPFFMFTKDLYQTYGGFDERFRALGDFEWWVRTAKHIDYCRGEALGGTFLFHGTNLSMNIQNNTLERNIIHLKHGNYHLIKWMDPRVFKQAIEKWADSLPPIPAKIQQKFLSPEAQTRWDRQAWRRLLFPSFAKAWLRIAINRSRLRILLYHLGIFAKSKYPY